MQAAEFRRTSDEAARRGHPSYVWRAGQARRLALVQQWTKLEGARILDAGCGVGLYTEKFGQYSPNVVGVEIDAAVAAEAQRRGLSVVIAPAEELPFDAASFDVVFSHEVIEHVTDDRRAAAEMVRVLAPGGRIALFCPNRLYPFETHGHYWRGKYHFGNTPLINWLPDPLRNRLAPHVRAYTRGGIRRLFAGQPVRVVHHTVIYPGFDNIVARRPALGRALKRVLYALEHTPLRWFGLSHFIVLERV
ncbi:MAG: putative S-adenosylmethionine-dependent methyltransferase [Chloroflexi bacterium ADurb.Bin325]|nr:MAG: putative S-adenosylmethionine-dependent methyltransferase [Chloroflexi bacterium ADurb.Bin325]